MCVACDRQPDVVATAPRYAGVDIESGQGVGRTVQVKSTDKHSNQNTARCTTSACFSFQNFAMITLQTLKLASKTYYNKPALLST